MHKSQTHSPSAEGSDRGPAKYFHWRKQILVKFGNTLWCSEQKETGTAFLIQGAPGAGKTALLYKCEELARDREWDTAEISSSALWDLVALRNCLGLKCFLGIRTIIRVFAERFVANIVCTGLANPQ